MVIELRQQDTGQFQVLCQALCKMLGTVSILLILLTVSACSRSQKVEQYAPPPPNHGAFDLSMLNNNGGDNGGESTHLLGTNASLVSSSHQQDQNQEQASLRTSQVLKKCRIKDRFDRKSLLAYEWDDARLGLDVDGINMGSTRIDKVRLEYKISLQPELEKKNHCRYASSFQGLIGSGYNELVLRKEDTVWEEINVIQAEISHHLTSMTQ